jgi:molecular chaperone DnaK
MIAFFELFVRFLPDLLRGAGVTLLLTAEGLAAGFVLGLLAALGRQYGGKFWQGLAVGYVELFRGTPLLMQLFLLYYGLPGLGVPLSREWAAFIALGLNSGAYQAEYLRGSILAVGEGVVEVKSTNGDTHLGGDNIDQRIIDWIVEEFKKQNGIDLSRDQMALQRLKEAAEKAKIELSTLLETEINLPFITADASGPKHLVMKLTRARFEQMVEDILMRSVAPCKKALADAGIDPSKLDEVVLVGGSTRIPRVQQIVRDLFGKEPHKGVNPDEVVAVGAAVQGGVLGGEVKDVVLLDVTPLSLGIETVGGVTSKIIARNSPIPASGSEMFTTFVDNQTAVDIHVLQGERELVADNRSLARFKLRGIPPMPAGLPRIQVRFQIDANGILSVGARELRTGLEQTIEVKPSYGLSDEEVERMLIESFEHAEEDMEARFLIETRNEADRVLRATEKALRDPDLPAALAELRPGELAAIEAAVADLTRLVRGVDRTAIEAGIASLNEATKHLAEVMMNRSIRAALAGRQVDEVKREGR